MNLIQKPMLAFILLAGIPSISSAETPIQITLCEVLRNPEIYNHKLIQVSGIVSRGFEDFTLTAENCDIEQKGVWLEIGGKIGSKTVYCCGDTNNQGIREQPLKIDNIETSLLADKTFKRFQTITNKDDYGSAKATIIGRFFSGTKQTFPKGTRWTGFGHFGFYSLLVIQQITSVEPK